MSRPVRVAVWALVIAVAVTALAVFGLSSDRSPAIGRAAPQLPAEHLVGPRVTLASLLAGAGGRPVAVVFWASWCDPCVHEAPALERFSQSRDGRGRIVGIDWSDALSGARSFIHQQGWSFPNVRDGDGLVGNRYRMTGLPTTFVLDSRGRIRAELRGPQSEASLRAALARVAAT